MPAPTRTLVQKLAEDVREGRLDPAAEVERAWSADDAESVATYALSAAVAGQPMRAASVLDAVTLLDDLTLGALLTANVSGDRVKALLDAVERDDTTDERDALALFLAATLRKPKPAPPRLLSLLRTHARRGVSTASGELLVAAAAAVADDEVRAVVARSLPEIRLRQALDATAPLLKVMELPVLEVLPDYAPPSLAAPITVRRTASKVGRNDPCPCGSGKKYKKCCEGKDAAAAADPELAWRKQLEAAAPTMTAQQVQDLRLADLASLAYESLTPVARLAAYRALLSHRRWDAAERALDAMASLGEDADGYRIELVDEAFRSRTLEVARKHAARLTEAGVVDPLVEAMTSVASPTRTSLSRLDALAEQGLREAPLFLFDIADALLTYYPALGVVAARGALTTERPEDSAMFLELIEEARDRLGLPPNDPAAAVYDAIEELGRVGDGAPASEEVVERLTAEAQALRVRAREASAKIGELESRLRERQRELTLPEVTGGAPAAPDADAEEKRRKLAERVAELKSLIAEGNAERAELRRKLAESSERARGPATPAVAPPQESASTGERDPDEAPRVRGVMVPRFARAAEASLRDLPARVVRDALRVVADLCSGEASALREVKQLERISPPMYSARIGIHYRVLFRMEPGVLDVAEVVAREGLLAAVRRFWR
ncbi:MAG TPA: SEC-C metal-binding domain-containing protein [Polyangiaceae bacterium]|jgi:hypothetical protein